MNNKFPFAKKKNLSLSFSPLEFGYELGQQCDTCSRKVIYNESITVCQCYRFFHPDCLTKRIETLNNKTENELTCKVCKNKLEIVYRHSLVFGPNFTLINILAILISLLSMIVSVAWGINLDPNNITEQVTLAIVMAMSLVAFFLSLGNSLIYKKVTIQSIKSTNLGLLVSAFADLEGEKEFGQEEETECEMVDPRF